MITSIGGWLSIEAFFS